MFAPAAATDKAPDSACARAALTAARSLRGRAPRRRCPRARGATRRGRAPPRGLRRGSPRRRPSARGSRARRRSPPPPAHGHPPPPSPAPTAPRRRARAPRPPAPRRLRTRPAARPGAAPPAPARPRTGSRALAPAGHHDLAPGLLERRQQGVAVALRRQVAGPEHHRHPRHRARAGGEVPVVDQNAEEQQRALARRERLAVRTRVGAWGTGAAHASARAGPGAAPATASAGSAAAPSTASASPRSATARRRCEPRDLTRSSTSRRRGRWAPPRAPRSPRGSGSLG
jgi:hypothetical protein